MPAEIEDVAIDSGEWILDLSLALQLSIHMTVIWCSLYSIYLIPLPYPITHSCIQVHSFSFILSLSFITLIRLRRLTQVKWTGALIQGDCLQCYGSCFVIYFSWFCFKHKAIKLLVKDISVIIVQCGPLHSVEPKDSTIRHESTNCHRDVTQSFLCIVWGQSCHRSTSIKLIGSFCACLRQIVEQFKLDGNY